MTLSRIIPSALAAVTVVAIAFGQTDRFWAARFSEESPGPPNKSWSVHNFPKIARHTRFALVRDGGGTVLKAESDRAASGLVKKMDIDPARYPYVEWSWKIDTVIDASGWGEKQSDDFAARFLVIFDGHDGAFSFFGRWMKRMGGGFNGKALSYVWAKDIERGTVAPSPYTESVAMIAVESGNENAGVWRIERRNVVEDFRAAFGTAPPPIVALAIMVDTDNTESRAVTFYGDIGFLPSPQ